MEAPSVLRKKFPTGLGSNVPQLISPFHLLLNGRFPPTNLSLQSDAESVLVEAISFQAIREADGMVQGSGAEEVSGKVYNILVTVFNVYALHENVYAYYVYSN